jgi:hypothetical protein
MTVWSRFQVAAIVVTALSTLISAEGQRGVLTETEVRQAVKEGQKHKGRECGFVVSDPGEVNSSADDVAAGIGLTAQVYTPFTWVEQQASLAAAQHRVLDAESLARESQDAVLRVFVTFDRSNYPRSFVPPATLVGRATRVGRHVVLRNLDETKTVQPVSTVQLAGQSKDGSTPPYSTGILAVFSLQSLADVRGSGGDDDFLVIVIGDKGLPRRLQIKGEALERSK